MGKVDEKEFWKTEYHKKLIKQDYYKRLTIRNGKTFDRIALFVEWREKSTVWGLYCAFWWKWKYNLKRYYFCSIFSMTLLSFVISLFKLDNSSHKFLQSLFLFNSSRISLIVLVELAVRIYLNVILGSFSLIRLLVSVWLRER